MHCPQHIQIREMLKKADKDLRPLPVRIALPVVRKFMAR
jgi:predicted aldo/keto reductase-like oxidoreductase